MTSVHTVVELRVSLPSIGIELETLALHPEGEFHRVVEIPTIFAAEQLGFRDLIRLSPAEAGRYEVLGVEEPGGWQRFDFIVSRDQIESAALTDLLAEVEAHGGKWIREFGGVLSVVLPPGSTWKPVFGGEPTE